MKYPPKSRKLKGVITCAVENVALALRKEYPELSQMDAEEIVELSHDGCINEAQQRYTELLIQSINQMARTARYGKPTGDDPCSQ